MQQKGSLYQLFFYVPMSHLEMVKEALFDAGGGKMGEYQRCAWQTLGEGQFEPIGNAQPFIGERGALEKVQEYRVEMVIEARFLSEVVSALIVSHPYEEPAYGVLPLVTLKELKLG